MPGQGALTIASRQAVGRRRPRSSSRSTDTGVGMDPEALARIFEPYFSTKATGTGLGLTIAKRNVELNGGTIEVASERGVGTTVTHDAAGRDDESAKQRREDVRPTSDVRLDCRR